MTTLTIHRYGDDALLVDLPDLASVRALDDALRADPPAGAVDVVPAAATVLVRCGSPWDLAPVETDVRRVWAAVGPGTSADGRPGPSAVVTIGVHYDGADLDDVARRTGLTVAEVVSRHTAGTYPVAFGGFVPGFAYLAGLDPALRVPRHDSPRQQVPAGSVAVAGEFTAVYPAASPGGWRLLGRTDAVLFDAGRTPPALLGPGARVRFVDLGAAADGSERRAGP
ncbi:5-oxoprolinase subunit B family protein [Cellulomonas hominis]